MSRENRERKEKRSLLIKAGRRKEAKALLIKLGIWEELKETDVADRILSAHYPQAEVVLAEEEESTDEKSRVSELRKILSEITFDCPLLGNGIRILDYFSRVKP